MDAKKAAILDYRINEYFNSRKSPALDKNGNSLIDAAGNELFQYTRPLTVTGLARALGFCSREELLNYKDKKSAQAIARALLEIEEYAEEKLFSKESFSGTKLFLSVNFPRYRSDAQSGAEEPFPEEFEDWAK